jgi:hypothetical protein
LPCEIVEDDRAVAEPCGEEAAAGVEVDRLGVDAIGDRQQPSFATNIPDDEGRLAVPVDAAGEVAAIGAEPEKGGRGANPWEPGGPVPFE